jgi:hypothetical protein
MIVAICFCAVALACWAFVALDLGRRAIEHARAVEERRSTNEHAALIAALAKRVEKLEAVERQTAVALSMGRSRA